MRTNEFDQPIGEPLPDWQPPKPPQPAVLEGRYCRLEPLSETHVGSLHESLRDSGDGEQWTYMSDGPYPDPDAFAARILARADDPELLVLAIVDPATGRATGTASYLRIFPALGTIEVGHIMFGAGLRRTPAATEAMYLMARHAFDLGYRRYEWKCDALNAASRAAAARLGFAYEGTWRKALVYKGRNRDTAWYAITDDDWRALRPVFERWLDPANFSQEGQRTSLSAETAAVRAALDGWER